MSAQNDLERLENALADRYQIERELGRGGMATVYLARDLRHERLVALKVLRPDIGAVLGAERFTREIKLAAKLQHPHIVSVYDSGATADGQLWFTMPYVEGESLRDRMQRQRQLPVEDALRIAREVALALDYAHRHGVIHRDIKPENILLVDGQAMVADFGIARALESDDGPRSITLTDSGMALGTPAYMSPEQTAGERNLDAATDVYSLGVLLYEMLAGEPPYTGPTAQAIAAKMISGDPIPVRRTRPTVPETVDTAIRKALSPVPADRFATTGDFARALEAAQSTAANSGAQATAKRKPRIPGGVALLGLGVLIGAGLLFAWRSRERAAATSSEPIGLAVLPFENLGDTTDASFADGVTDAVRGKLAGLPQLMVIASTSSGQYRGTTKSPQEIGRELGVRYLVVGRVRWARGGNGGDRVQVSPELIDAQSASDRWQDAFDAPLTDVFRVQADIASRVAQALQVAITPVAQQALSESPTTNLDAYDAYVRAEALMTITDEKQMRDAIALYRRAVTIDSNYALAYAGLGAALAVLYGNFDPDSSILLDAKAAIDHALQLAPRAAEVVLAQGAYYEATRNLTAATERYRAAYQLDPNFARALFWAGDVESYAGNWKDALEDYKRAVALNPSDWSYHSRAGKAYESLGQYAAAEREYDRTLALVPHVPFVYVDKALLLIRARGDTAGARRLYDTAVVQCGSERFATTIAYDWLLPIRVPDALAVVKVDAFGRDTTGYYLLRGAYYRSRGVSDRARAYADSARVRIERIEGVGPPNLRALLALLYVYLGRTRDATREIDAAVQMPATIGGQTELARYLRTYVHARAGNVSEALADLEEQVDRPPDIATRAQLRVDPNWDFLRNDPRFQRLIAAPTATPRS